MSGGKILRKRFLAEGRCRDHRNASSCGGAISQVEALEM